MIHRGLGLLGLSMLAGCASLPSSGPTASQIESASAGSRNGIGYMITSITPELIASTRSARSGAFETLSVLANSPASPRSDIVRPGDQLAISIYEVGVSLFGTSTTVGTAQNAIASPTANAQRVSVQVDDSGAIYLPYVGSVQAAGQLPADIQRTIQSRLRPISQSPDVVVSVLDTVENVAYLTGAVARPGRYRLSAAREHVLDAIALAGGASIDPYDAEVRIVRGSIVGQGRLGELRVEDPANLVLQPGDRVEIVREPRSFTVFGAVDKVSQIPFGAGRVTLAEAIARAGGPAEARADPRAVFLFRFDADADRPVIYKLNMQDAQSYFLSQQFFMRDKDVLYFANSPANPPSKLIALINQLFSPAIAARYLVN